MASDKHHIHQRGGHPPLAKVRPGGRRIKRRTFPRIRPAEQLEHHHNAHVVLLDPAAEKLPQRPRVDVPRQSYSIQPIGAFMNDTHSFFSRFCHPPIPLRTAVMLVALTLSCLTSSCVRRVGEIHDAAQIGDLDKVKALLNRNPDLVFSKSGDYGETPLHVAALWGHKSVAEYLLMHRADVNAKNNYGGIPLHE